MHPIYLIGKIVIIIFSLILAHNVIMKSWNFCKNHDDIEAKFTNYEKKRRTVNHEKMNNFKI